MARLPVRPLQFQKQIDKLHEAMAAQGWKRFPSDGSLDRAFAYGVSLANLIEHFKRVAAKYRSAPAAGVDGHGSNLELGDLDYLRDGTGLGFTAWSATEDELTERNGYTSVEFDAASALAQKAGRKITDFLLYKASNGKRGWEQLGSDKRGYSSDNTLPGAVNPWKGRQGPA